MCHGEFNPFLTGWALLSQAFVTLKSNNRRSTKDMPNFNSLAYALALIPLGISGAIQAQEHIMDQVWGHEVVNASEANQISLGTDIVIAVIEGGIDISHPDIQNNVWVNADEIPDNNIDDDNNGYIDDVNGWDFFNNDETLEDLNGLGTFTAGLIAAHGHNGQGLTGVAPEAKIMALKLQDTSTTVVRHFDSVSVGNYINAIQYAIDNNADIINLREIPPDVAAIKRILEEAIASNIVVVIPSSTTSYFNSQLRSMAVPHGAIRVGLVENIGLDNLGLSRRNSSGPDLDLVAPDEALVSLLSSEYVGSSEAINDLYVSLWNPGAAASAYTSAVAALVKSTNSDQTAAQIRSKLIRNTQHLDFTSPGWNDDAGHGLLNAYQSVADTTNGSLLTPVITSPTIDQAAPHFVSVNSNLVVEGYVTNANEEVEYELSIARETQELPEYEIVSEGTISDTSRLLASVNIDHLENGTHYLRLRVFDTNGISADTYQRVEIDGALESGWPQFSDTGFHNYAGYLWSAYDWSYSPTLVDLDGDGIQEIIVKTDRTLDRRYNFNVFRHDGSRLFPPHPIEDTNLNISTPITIADLNNDGVNEIIFGTNREYSANDLIYAYSLSGEILPGFPAGWTYQGSPTSGYADDTILVTDFNGDGANEIIAKQTFNINQEQLRIQEIVAIDSAGNMLPNWPLRETLNYGVPFRDFTLNHDHPLALLDWDEDGTNELVTVWGYTEFATLSVINSEAEIIDEIPTDLNNHHDIQNILVADLDGDLVDELIYFENSRIHKINAGGEISPGWPIETGLNGSRPLSRLYTSNVTGDSSPELIVQTKLNGFRHYSADGELIQDAVIWPREPNVYSRTGETSVIATGSADSSVYYFTNTTRGLISMTVDGEVLTYQPHHPPAKGSIAISDIDLDDVYEAVIRTKDGMLHVREVMTIPENLSTSWLTFDADEARSRNGNNRCQFKFRTMSLRGTFNGWSNSPMTQNHEQCVWESRVTLTDASDDTFKFDVYGNWDRNYGLDINNVNVLIRHGNNIPMGSGQGEFIIRFNDMTNQYTVTAPPPPESIDVTFSCHNGATTNGISVYVVGNTPALGNWKITDSSQKLSPTNYPTWKKNLSMPANSQLEWKCVKAEEDTWKIIQWEGGVNNILTTQESSTTTNGHF